MVKIKNDSFVISVFSKNPCEDLAEMHSELVDLLYCEDMDMKTRRPAIYQLLNSIFPDCSDCPHK